MSASIFWSPINKQVVPNAGSSVYEALRRAFGDLPTEMDDSAINKLEGMAATWTTNPLESNPYQALIDAIVEFGSINVSAEF